MTVERKKTVGIWSARRFNRPRLAQTRLSEIRSASLLVARYTRAPIFPFHRNGFWRKSSSRAFPLPLRGFSLSACQLCQRRLQPQPPSCSRPHKAVLCLPRRRWKRCRAVFFPEPRLINYIESVFNIRAAVQDSGRAQDLNRKVF